MRKLVVLGELGLALVLCIFTAAVFAQPKAYPPTEKVAADFAKLLDRPRVSPKPFFETHVTDSVIIERGYIYSEVNEKVPILIYKPKTGRKAYPVVIILHGTGGSKDNGNIRNILYLLTKRGIMGVAIDARFHGARIPGGAHGSREYVAAATAAWENKDPATQMHPFFFDTVYDLWRVTDYLVTRADVQANRIGMSGISMGGIETWMAASVDHRIKAAVVDIGVQSFKWSLENKKWQGRVATIKDTHLQAAKDLGDTVLNQLNVKAVWDKLIPGITDEFDCPSMLRLFAPRPLLILSNELDQNCPLPGAVVAYNSAKSAYGAQGADGKLKMNVALGLGHMETAEHLMMTVDWFAKWL